MRHASTALLAATVLCTSAASTHQATAFSMIVHGPTVLKNNGPAGTYLVTMGFGGKPAKLDFQPSSPLYLTESDGTLLSFTSVHMAPGQNAQTVQMSLSCKNGRIGGTAAKLAAGSPNNPVSSAGIQRPARIWAKYEGWDYNNTDQRGAVPHIGNVVAIACIP